MKALATYQARLESRRHALSERLGLVTPSTEIATGDLVDQAATHGERLILYASREHLLSHLREIEEALERISGGRYGLCLGCNQQIVAARLAVFPEAALCVRCKEQTELHVRSGPIHWNDDQC